MRDNVHFWRQSYFANTELGVQTLKSKQKTGLFNLLNLLNKIMFSEF